MIRTGALSGIATKYLSREDSRKLCVIGTGEQAKGLVEAVLAVREIDEIRLYNRTSDAALEETGDLQVPIKEGVFKAEDLHGELGQIVNGELNGRESPEEITVFKSVGLAVVDIIVAKYFYDKAIKHNIGTRI